MRRARPPTKYHSSAAILLLCWIRTGKEKLLQPDSQARWTRSDPIIYDRHPFNDHVIASGSDDGKIFIWEVPQDFTLYTDGEEVIDVHPASKLAGHSRYGTTAPAPVPGPG